jgi:vitamin B12/bleomycin/antimicrobial peptide transport system ATP-binding/permease protein
VINTLLAAISLIGIRWVVGGSLNVGGVSIPGYMVFACIIYTSITTIGMFLLGQPLVKRVEERATGEAQLIMNDARERQRREYRIDGR